MFQGIPKIAVPQNQNHINSALIYTCAGYTYYLFIKRIICKRLIVTFVKTHNANCETGIFLDNIHGEVLNIETSPAILATADDFNAVWN